MDTLSMLYHPEARFGTQMEQVLELQEPRLPIWRQFGSLKINEIWSLERTNGLRGFVGEFKVSKWAIVEVSPRVYTVLSKYKVAFVNMNDLIDL